MPLIGGISLDLRMDFFVFRAMTPKLVDTFAQDATADKVSCCDLVTKLDNAERRLLMIDQIMKRQEIGTSIRGFRQAAKSSDETYILAVEDELYVCVGENGERLQFRLPKALVDLHKSY